MSRNSHWNNYQHPIKRAVCSFISLYPPRCEGCDLHVQSANYSQLIQYLLGIRFEQYHHFHVQLCENPSTTTSTCCRCLPENSRNKLRNAALVQCYTESWSTAGIDRHSRQGEMVIQRICFFLSVHGCEHHEKQRPKCKVTRPSRFEGRISRLLRLISYSSCVLQVVDVGWMTENQQLMCR